MTPLRFSIRAMIFLVLVVAVDFASVQKIIEPAKFGWANNSLTMETVLGLGEVGLELPFLGMANVLAFAGYFLLARREGRPRRSAFVIGGLFASVACYCYLRAFPVLGNALFHLFTPFQQWIMDNSNPGTPGHDAWYYTYLSVMGLAGTLALVVLAALSAVLIRLVARRKVPWFVALALVVVVMGSASLRLRYVRFREMANRSEEICAVLASELATRMIQLETAKAAKPPLIAPVGGPIPTQEAEIAQYQLKLAEQRREVVKYRRAMSRPWMPVEE